MNPSQLDESLLTAYLDGELSEQERTLVEEQLKVNEHWKQLLGELRNVQSLIRELPTPVLDRSLSSGPWTQNVQQNPAVGTIGRWTNAVNRGSFPMSIFAIAASLLCVVGSLAWMRLGKVDLQVAEMEKIANIDAIARDELPAAPADKKDMSDSTIAASSATGHDDTKSNQPLGRIEQKRKTATMPAVPENDVSIASTEASKQMLESSPPMPAATTEPVDTFFAVRAESLVSPPQGGLPNESTVRDSQAAAKDDFLAQSAGAAAPLGLQDERFDLVENLARQKNRSAGQPRELRILRSELPLVIQQLGELGWKVQVETIPVEQGSRSSRSILRLDKSQSVRRENSPPRPPTLTGVIDEATDWIRIIFEGE